MGGVRSAADARTAAGAELTAGAALVLAGLVALLVIRGSKTSGRGWLVFKSIPLPPAHRPPHVRAL